MDNLDQQLKDLKQQEDAARAALGALVNTRHLVELAIVKRDHGVEVGSIVRLGCGDVYRVTTVRPWGHRTPDIKGHKQIKDGTFSGARELRIYGKWGVVTDAKN